MTSPTLVLDLDGTLVDTAADLVRALNAVIAPEGLAAVPVATGVRMVGHGARAMINAALAAAGEKADPDRLDRLMARFLEYYAENIVVESQPYPGAMEALDRFAAAGWRLAICTNKYEAPSRLLLGRLALADRFAVIAGQDTYGVKKPDPLHLTETIRFAGGDPRRAVMVGDSEVDVGAARAAGVPVVAVSFGYSGRPVADLGADRVIDSYAALFDAAHELLGVARAA